MPINPLEGITTVKPIDRPILSFPFGIRISHKNPFK